MYPAVTLILAALFAALIYFFLVRPWILHWGATQAEIQRVYMGDELVTQPHFVATRAVTIQAAPADVWRWILQIGSARAGWYSHDWLDNAGVESSHEILPQFQKIEPGYFIPFTPDQKNGMWVKEYQEPHVILWWDKKLKATWLWQIDEIAPNQTRLVTRLRTVYDFSFPWVIYYLVYDFGDLIMMSKCMLGIKARAEALVPAN